MCLFALSVLLEVCQILMAFIIYLLQLFTIYSDMAFQKLSREEGKVEILLHLTGFDLIGTLLNAPLSVYKQVYVLPMMHIDPEKVIE